jgi:flagellar biosynthesis protein FlhG
MLHTMADPDHDPDETASGTSPRGVRHLLAVGGGRGGVGSSIFALNLAIYLAQLGRRVVLVDVDGAGGELHTMLGMSPPAFWASADRDDDDDVALRCIDTPVPGLQLLPQVYSIASTVPLRPGRKPRWARKLRQLDVDYVLLDLGQGTNPTTLDLFLSADIGVCLTSPEPPSVEATYRFACAAFQRRVRRMLLRDRFRIRLVDRAHAELKPLAPPQALVAALARYDTALAEQIHLELARFRPKLVVNHVRLRTDSELGPAMADMAEKYLGIHYDPVGCIEQDDAVWLSVVRNRPLLIDSPTSKSARNLERIARRLVALTHATADRSQEKASLLQPEPSLYDVLFTHRGASDEELRRAYRRQREIYQPGSLPLTSLLTTEELQREQARIEEAHDTLLDSLKRKAYDKSTFPEEPSEAPRKPPLNSVEEAERALLREELAREIGAETEFTGDLLRKVREAQGVELQDIATFTKISAAHLTAIENDDFHALPAVVYVRGFVQQIAKFLELDPTQVSRSYLRRLRAWRSREETKVS